jgi:TolB-like protein
MTIPDELWILIIMAGVILLLGLTALIMFAPPPPSVPPEGPIRFSVKPFQDLEPDPAQLYLGDGLARSIVQSLDRYGRVEASVGDAPSRFLVSGKVRKKGTRLAVQAKVTSDGRAYWAHSFDVKEEDGAAATAKAVDALARKMKLTLK